jgi:CBS domain-containing protein
MAKMKVREAMTTKVRTANPEQTICEAACLMAECDAGILPVGQNDRLVGVITDRDIAIRAVAQGKSPQTPVSEVMSKEVLYCFEDEELEHVAKNMGDVKVRRLPVLNRKKRLVGIVSVGDLAQTANAQVAGRAVADISKPGGAHSQPVH